MKVKDCAIGFGLTLAGGIGAGLAFSFIGSRLVAGAVAGAGFVIVGVYCLYIAMKAAKPYQWMTFYTAAVHLFFVSIPMIIVRWMDPSTPFNQMSVWGIPGPQFHLWSMYFYRILLAGLVIDGLRAWWIQRSPKKNSAV